MSPDECQPLLNEFRQNLVAFYAALHLAPPYHSVEQAIQCLASLFKAQTAEQQAQLLTNEASRWNLYLQAFTDSGLHNKHRGIIARHARDDDFHQIPDTLRYLLEPFRL